MADEDRISRHVAIVLKGYPRLSETFIAQEIHQLEQLGLPITLYSLRHPTDTKRHPVHDEIKAKVFYLPEYLHQEPLRVLRSWFSARRYPGYKRALGRFVKDLKRDWTRNRVRRFGQALVLAVEMPPATDFVYSHFLHTPSSAARYAAIIRGVEWGFSAHAKDIWTISEWEKTEKIADAAWGVTCTESGCEHLNGLDYDGPRKVALVYHGIDLSRFAAPDGERRLADGTNVDDPVRIVSVGRMVAKKGYDDLIEALARLPGDLSWKFIHIGGGELGSELKQLAESAGISDKIEWRGAQSQGDVKTALKEADIFALMSKIDVTGDRDGLPNVLMEAQSQNVVCIATNVSAIPELIRHGETGYLVEPEDADGMSQGLAQLIGDPELRIRYGQAGGERVRTDFSHHACIGVLAEKLGLRESPAKNSAG